MDDDPQLGRDYAEGGEAAFAAVYARYRGPVFGIALHVLADRGLAEEASQVAFVGVWRSRQRFDPDRGLSAWVFSIARRAAIDIYRRERRTPVTTGEQPEVAVEGMSVERMWQTWEIRRAVEALPAEEAAIVRLAHYYQMTHTEIAAHLGLPVGTVKSRSFRAHKRLAEALRHLFDAAEPPVPPTARPPAARPPAARPPAARTETAAGVPDGVPAGGLTMTEAVDD
jgi:RNA polymerase sigma-70 factor, ECF subfamily